MAGAASGDSVDPIALDFSPVDEAVGIAVSSNIVITFSEAVQLGSGTIVLKNASGTVIETFSSANNGNVSISGDVLTINPIRVIQLNLPQTVSMTFQATVMLASPVTTSLLFPVAVTRLQVP